MIRTGIGCADITPQGSVPLMGYGDRTQASQGVHDPLLACAWWLEPPGGRPLVWLVLDLCLMSVLSARELAGELAAGAGLDPEQLFVSTSHTHSGPEVLFLTRASEPWAERYRRKLRGGCAEAIRRARAQAVEGRIEVRLGRSDLGLNRRDAAAPIDATAGEVRCPIRVLDLGEVKILGAPLEVLLEVAFDWQRRLPGHIALIAGLFGGWLGYLPHRDNYAEPGAAQLYETASTMFAPQASIRLLDSAQRLLAEP